MLSLGGVQVVYELQALEEEEKVHEEVQEIERESPSGEKRSDDHDPDHEVKRLIT